MLEKPAIDDQAILDNLLQFYGLQVRRLLFLPLGADVNTAVYHVEAQDGAACFLKLRKGKFEETSVTLPRFLHSQGIAAVIPPLETQAGLCWSLLGDFTLVLYPFIVGQDGYTAALSEGQWRRFGATLRAIHTTQVPEVLACHIPRETFSAQTRQRVRQFQAFAETARFEEPIADKTAAFMRGNQETIDRLVLQAGDLAASLQKRHLDLVLCHADLHPGNLFFNPSDLFLVDWDNPIFAPKEYDLSLIGGMQIWNDPPRIELFYQGYGAVPIDATALAYYRHERILLDIAEFCKQLLLSATGAEDRERSYRYFTDQFEPGHEVELAFSST